MSTVRTAIAAAAGHRLGQVLERSGAGNPGLTTALAAAGEFFAADPKRAASLLSHLVQEHAPSLAAKLSSPPFSDRPAFGDQPPVGDRSPTGDRFSGRAHPWMPYSGGAPIEVSGRDVSLQSRARERPPEPEPAPAEHRQARSEPLVAPTQRAPTRRSQDAADTHRDPAPLPPDTRSAAGDREVAKTTATRSGPPPEDDSSHDPISIPTFFSEVVRPYDVAGTDYHVAADLALQRAHELGIHNLEVRPGTTEISDTPTIILTTTGGEDFGRVTLGGIPSDVAKGIDHWLDWDARRWGKNLVRTYQYTYPELRVGDRVTHKQVDESRYSGEVVEVRGEFPEMAAKVRLREDVYVVTPVFYLKNGRPERPPPT